LTNFTMLTKRINFNGGAFMSWPETNQEHRSLTQTTSRSMRVTTTTLAAKTKPGWTTSQQSVIETEMNQSIKRFYLILFSPKDESFNASSS